MNDQLEARNVTGASAVQPHAMPTPVTPKETLLFVDLGLHTHQIIRLHFTSGKPRFATKRRLFRSIFKSDWRMNYRTIRTTFRDILLPQALLRNL